MKKFDLSCQLQKKSVNMLKKNPHCIQYFCNDSNKISDVIPNSKIPNSFKYERSFKSLNNYEITHLSKNNYKNFKKNELFKTVDDVKKYLKKFNLNPIYSYRQKRPTTTLHIGQLKLFLSTLQFLLYYAPKNQEVHVIYPGSAPGNNIPFLIELFPHCKWHLIDPRKHNKNLYKNSNVVDLQKSLFTDDMCRKKKKELENKYTLLISDIRIEPENIPIDRDNRLQEKWVKILKPNYAQLKWRIPRFKYKNNNKKYKIYKYLDGINYLQIFAPPSSTETRLVVNGKQKLKNKSWNPNHDENVMYYFNRVLRPSYYTTNKYSHKCTDKCHDCSLMFDLISQYKSKYSENKFSNNSIPIMIDNIFKKIKPVKFKICSQYKTTLNNIK
jgi:hypothetical protein